MSQETDLGIMVDSILKIAPGAASTKNCLVIRSEGSGITKTIADSFLILNYLRMHPE